MEGTRKVVRLPTKHCPSGHSLRENMGKEAVTSTELYGAVAKAKNVIDTMEKEWQADHGSPVLMDHLYLLRNYLECVRRYHEGN